MFIKQLYLQTLSCFSWKYDCYYFLLMKAQGQGNQTTSSQQRAKILSQESDRVGKMFQVDNFYENNHINVKKLKQRIIEAKKKLLTEKTNEIKQTIMEKSTEDRTKYFSMNHQKTKRCDSRVTQHRRARNEKRVKRLVTDLGDFDVQRRLIETKSRVIFGHETPSVKDSRSILSVALEFKKKLLSKRVEVQQFELKIGMLWDLYEILIDIMQNFDKFQKINEKTVQFYIKEVFSAKYEFIHEICQVVYERRSQRTIRMTRLFQNLSIFQACLYTVEKKKGASAEIINCLGYSSSSIVFLIKLIFTTHQTALTLSQKTLQILNSINQFEHGSYLAELRNPKEILRRMEHNNEIISMLKTRCGRKHGKYCQEFITQIIKTVECNPFMPFNEVASNIFQFLSFHLHQEGNAGRLPMLALPPTPFLSLKYPKTIVIEPWGVLVYRKHDKLVIRAHTGKFLTEISDGCNLVFWTELMPKDADVLTNFLPVKDNIYWLYRYHCTASLDFSHRPIKSSSNKLKSSPYKKNHIRLKTDISVDASQTRFTKDLAKIGCILQNTILIDYDKSNVHDQQHEYSVLMPWKGERKDVKLLQLSEGIQKLRKQSELNTKPWIHQIGKLKSQMEPAERKLLRKQRISMPKSSLA